jgi:translation initiation factor IF-2
VQETTGGVKLLNKQDNKLRVYEYAKSLNMSSKEIITILKRLNIPVNNHMSVMETEAVHAVEQFFRDIKANAAAKQSGGTSKPEQAKIAAQNEARQAESQQANKQPSQQQAGSQQSIQQEQAQKPSAAQQSNRQAAQGHQNDQREQRDHRNNQQRQLNNGQPQGRKPQQNNKPNDNRGGQPQAQEQSQQNNGQLSRNRNEQRPNNNNINNSRRNNNNQYIAQKTVASSPQKAQDIIELDLDDTNISTGKTTKKTKPKRFDDNKANNHLKGHHKPGNNKGNNKGKQQEQRKEKIDNTPKKIIVRGTMTVGETAKALHKDASEVIKKLLFLGVMATINQELDLDAIQLLAAEFGVEVELKIPVEEDKFELIEEKDDEADLQERPPVVTIMGHVDHGKTTLLDAIRKTNVTEGEAGGITQHIGAYQVEIHGKKITFLDTPGHEAFTSMRARGAQVTDITVLVVAADDGVMPQTVEAINHAKAANVPIIVAVNKIDKPEANPDRVKQELTEYGLVPEEWGGDTIFCNVSAKQRIGLENILDMILLVAEVQELKANPNKRARGTVLEAELDKGKGPVARVLIQHGTLKIGDSFVAGCCFGRVRAMVNDKGKKLKEAGPSTPVEITGLTEVPQAGDPFMCFEDERKARAIAEKRAITQRQAELGSNARVTLDDLYKHIKDGEIKDLNVIIKGDVQGSVEALKGSLEKINIEGVRVKILHTGVGAITESDVILASASNAIVIGFNVRPEPQAKNTAEQEKVDIRLHRVIYNVIDEIEAAMKGMLDPVFKENVIGHAEVRNIFKVSKIGTIAGCMVTSGKIIRNAEVRLIRSGIVVYEGKIESLKRFKDDAKEVAQGLECGISLEKFNDIKEGDIIEAFVMETVER